MLETCTYCRAPGLVAASPGDKHLLFGEPGIQGRMLCSIDRLNAAARGKEENPRYCKKRSYK